MIQPGHNLKYHVDQGETRSRQFGFVITVRVAKIKCICRYLRAYVNRSTK